MTNVQKAKVEKPGDRRTGITAHQAATAATLNVVESGLSDQEFAALVVEQLTTFISGRRSRLPHRLASITKAIRRDHFLQIPYWPKLPALGDIDHQPYIEHLLHPSTGSFEGSLVASELLDVDPTAHAKALDELRTLSGRAHDKIYRLLVTGHIGRIIQCARDRTTSGIEAARLIDIARTHARCLVIRFGHARIGDIALLSRQPLGGRFAGFNTWHLVGHSCLATIAAPAVLLQRLPGLAGQARFQNMDDAALLHILTKENILAADGSGRIMSIARKVVGMLHDGGIHEIDTGPILKAIARTSERASHLNMGVMKKAGWSKIDFAAYRTGLSATEASAFVALRTMQALRRIDECIAAIERGEGTSSRDHSWTPKKAPLGYATVILRAEGLPDRHARPHDPSLNGRHIDKDRGSGRTAVASMLTKIADPNIRAQAERYFGVDADAWFRH